MPRVWRTIIVTALIAFAAGVLGVYAGSVLFNERADHGSLDLAVHRELDLSAEQERQLEAIEARFAEQRHDCESDMRAATREIAAAMNEDKTYTPRVERAVNHFHAAMGRLQHATIQHVFEMRAVLTPAQQVRFDEIVRRELLNSDEAAE